MDPLSVCLNTNVPIYKEPVHKAVTDSELRLHKPLKSMCSGRTFSSK